MPDLRKLGKYELMARIGEGGMAEVFIARQTGPLGFQKVVVVKAIHPHLAREQEFIDMLLDEARVSALIKHPRVVDIYDLGIEDNTYFIAMEYIAGQPLSKVLAASRKLNKKLDIFSTAQIIADAADGLDAAHNLKSISGEPMELVHRDVSPGNIMVQYNGNVKLLDFGVSKSMGRISTTSSGQLKGKLGYVSPEQLEERPLDRRSDVFALGVVLWESLCLRRLYRATTPAATIKKILDGKPPRPSDDRREVPAELDNICLKALELRPEDRFQSAREMRSAIQSFLRDSNYYGERNRISMFMSLLFSDRRREEEALLKAVARAQSEIPVERRVDDDYELGDDTDQALVARIAKEIGPDIEVVVGPRGEASAERVDADDTAVEIDAIDIEMMDEPQSQVPPPAIARGPVEPITIRPQARRSRRWLWVGVVCAVAAAAGLLFVMTWLTGGNTEASADETSAARATVDPQPHAVAAPDPTRGSKPDLPAEPALAPGEDEPPVTPDPDRGRVEPPPTDEPVAPDEPGDEPEAEPEPAVEPAADEPAPTEEAPTEPAPKVHQAMSSAERRRLSQSLYDEGTKLFVRGELGGAKAKFKRALAVNAGFAPAYRGMGLVYEKMGNRSRAVYYLRKYLRYRPTAGDAAAIKSRIVRLGGSP